MYFWLDCSGEICKHVQNQLRKHVNSNLLVINHRQMILLALLFVFPVNFEKTEDVSLCLWFALKITMFAGSY